MAFELIHRLLGRDELESAAVHLDIQGLVLRKTGRRYRVWNDEVGDAISLLKMRDRGFELRDLTEVNEVRGWCRREVEGRGRGLVQAEETRVRDARAIAWISKRAEGSGYHYEGMLFLPLPSEGYLFVVSAFEGPTTGIREALVVHRLLADGTIDPGDLAAGEAIPGWFFDPYDEAYEGVILNSVSDEPAYDELVPDHPLSRVRRRLESLRDSIRIEGSA